VKFRIFEKEQLQDEEKPDNFVMPFIVAANSGSGSSGN
jgi:hypothetical protein